MANTDIAPVVTPVADEDDEVDDAVVADLENMVAKLTNQLKDRR